MTASDRSNLDGLVLLHRVLPATCRLPGEGISVSTLWVDTSSSGSSVLTRLADLFQPATHGALGDALAPVQAGLPRWRRDFPNSAHLHSVPRRPARVPRSGCRAPRSLGFSSTGPPLRQGPALRRRRSLLGRTFAWGVLGAGRLWCGLGTVRLGCGLGTVVWGRTRHCQPRSPHRSPRARRPPRPSRPPAP